MKEKRTESVAWECKHCGHRHLWKWFEFDCYVCELDCRCDKCDGNNFGLMVPIGNHAWAVARDYL